MVCNVNPGFEHPNPWTLNLRANPRARIQLGGEVLEVMAHEASEGELARYWPQLTNVWPAYQAFYAQGGLRSIFVLDPVTGQQAQAG